MLFFLHRRETVPHRGHRCGVSVVVLVLFGVPVVGLVLLGITVVVGLLYFVLCRTCRANVANAIGYYCRRPCIIEHYCRRDYFIGYDCRRSYAIGYYCRRFYLIGCCCRRPFIIVHGGVMTIS